MRSAYFFFANSCFCILLLSLAFLGSDCQTPTWRPPALSQDPTSRSHPRLPYGAPVPLPRPGRAASCPSLSWALSSQKVGRVGVGRRISENDKTRDLTLRQNVRHAGLTTHSLSFFAFAYLQTNSTAMKRVPTRQKLQIKESFRKRPPWYATIAFRCWRPLTGFPLWLYHFCFRISPLQVRAATERMKRAAGDIQTQLSRQHQGIDDSKCEPDGR